VTVAELAPVPTRFRRRLTLAFVLVAALSAGLVAMGSFAAIREYRLRQFEERAEREARVPLSLAPTAIEGGRVEGLVELYGDGVVYDVVVVTDGTVVASRPGLGLDDLPDGFEAPASRDDIPRVETDIDGQPFLVLGGRVEEADAAVYVLASRAELLSSLRQYGVALAVAWLAVVIIAAVVGAFIARKTLGPLAAAAAAAKAVTEGTLDTHLDFDSRDEFGVLAQSFNQMTDAVRDKIRSLSEARDRERRFTADVAHDLRTPVTALVSEAALVARRMDQLPEDVRRPVELLVHDVDRLRCLVEDLLELARLDAGDEIVDEELIELSAAALAVIAGIDHPVRIEGDPVTVSTDRRRLHRILANLVANAIQHGGGDVVIRTREEGTIAAVEITDHGPGINPEHLPHLFDRFYKPDPTRSSGGTGLGLAIVAEQTKLLGAHVDVESAPGHGTTFTVRFPRTPGNQS
jgi:two-component system sensor histidine kinase MtrB